MSYFKSKDVRVFPCSYRGNYEKNNGSVTFDPEARLNTESNLINAGGKLGIKESYLIEKTSDNVAKFVICGYYFEISNINNYNAELSNKRLFVKLANKPIKDDDGTDRARSTKVLDSWENGSASLDILKDGEYYFTGILIGDSATVGTGASGALDISTEAAKLPSIDSGTGVKSVVIGKENVASGENSFAGGSNSEASKTNSIAFGDHVEANWDNLVAIGKFNNTEENDLFVVGNGTSAARSNVVQVNANKVNINKETNIAGNVTINGTEKVSGNLAVGENKFFVDAESGNTDISGNLVVQSNKFKVETANEKTTITENGDVNISGRLSVGARPSKATMKVYVAGGVEASGKITANSDINATGIITTAGIKEDEAKIDISKNVNITKNINVTGDGSISGSLTASSLTINQDKLVVDNTKVYTSLPLEAKSFKTASLNVDELIINENETNNWKALEIKKGTDKENKNLTVINANESKIVLENGMKSMLLNLFYPIGSIYTSTELKDGKCPIAATLGGEWTQIKGRFLVAAGQDEDSGLNLSAGNKGGSKDAVAVSHTHTATSENNTAGLTTNGTYKEDSDSDTEDTKKTLYGTLYTGRGEYNRYIHALDKDKVDNVWNSSECIGVDSGYGNYYVRPDFTMQEIQVRPNQWHKPDRLKFNFKHRHSIESHNHAITVNENTDRANQPISGTDKNMPPYLVVYMWKRVA